MKKLFAALKSMKLAVGLIAYLAVALTAATLVPQGLEEAEYRKAYPKLAAEILLGTGFTRFFTSVLFLLPALAFFANLGACAIDRLARELRKKARRRHGPDILHLGLLLLIVGAVVSFSTRQEGAVTLGEGDSVELPDGRILRLESFETRLYEDGRPLDWISVVSLRAGENIEVDSYPIRVNHPLKLGGLSIYQFSHSAERVLELRDRAGRLLKAAQGEEIGAEGARLLFMAPADGSGKLVLRLSDDAGSRVIRASVGETAGPFEIQAVSERGLTGLQAVADPGYALVLAGLLVSALGLALTFIQKLGDTKP